MGKFRVIIILSLILNFIFGYGLIKTYQEKNYILETYQLYSTNLISKIKVSKSFLEIILNNKENYSIEDLVNLETSFYNSSEVSLYHDLHLSLNYSIKSNLKTIIDRNTAIIDDFVLKALDKSVTEEDWIKLNNVYQDLEILTDIISSDTLIKGNKSEIKKMYENIPYDKLN